LQNVFFALRDTRTPAKVAAVRLVVSASLGALLMHPFDWLSVRGVLEGLVSLPERAGAGASDLYLGAIGLTLGSSIGAWVEFALLVSWLRRHLPALRLPWGAMVARFALAVVMLVPALALWAALAERSVFLQAALVLPTYAVSYLGYARLRRMPELGMWLGR
jgi:putative peptidoglycan lipid II flippase